MKTTLLLASFCCASAFGLNGKPVSALKKVGNVQAKPMVQPIDIQGNRLATPNSVVSSTGRRVELVAVAARQNHEYPDFPWLWRDSWNGSERLIDTGVSLFSLSARAR